MDKQLKAIALASQQYHDRVLRKRKAKSPEEPTKFALGEYVLCKYPVQPEHKLQPFWKGPLIITAYDERRDGYTLTDLVTGRPDIDVHVTRLKRYTAEDNGPFGTRKEAALMDTDEQIVDMIVAHRGSTRKDLKFKVRWLDQTESWEPFKELRQVKALDTYISTRKKLYTLLKSKSN